CARGRGDCSGGVCYAVKYDRSYYIEYYFDFW
nr:immunoglobulin heavy chain junction region [Macaca mulatta]